MYRNDEGQTVGQRVVREYEVMKSQRQNWDEYWEELAEYFLPNKDNVYGYKLEGERKHNRLYDSTSIHSLEMLASSLHGMLTNPASVWFGLSSGDPQVDMLSHVNKYLQTCTSIMIETLNQSNFQEEIHETYLDLGGIGTTVLEMEEDKDKSIRFKSSPIYTSYVSENHFGVIDKLARCIKMSNRNIVGKYGEDALKGHPDALMLAQQKPEEKEEVIFLIEPDGKKYKAYHVHRKLGIVLKETIYHSWPFAIPRWTKLNEEVYGRCPAMKCLPDVKMVNAVMKTTIRGMQKVVDPPLMVPDQGFLLPIKTTPGGTNFYRTGMKDRIEPFPTTARPDVGLDFIENIRERIRESFFADQLQLINQRDMTATEVMQRTDERLRFLGPVIGRLNNELLKPIIDRTFDILGRQGKFPRPPEELKNKSDLKVVYTSQIARAQRTGELNTLIKVIQATEPIIAAQPDVMDNFDGDEVLRYHANVLGLHHSMLKDTRKVKEIRQSRAEQQQQMMQAQQENIQADTAQMSAKAQQAP